MKRNLIICNTTYQLLVSLNLRLVCLQQEETDIILTDRTDFSKTWKQLADENIFSNVYVIAPKKNDEKKGWFARKFSEYIYPLECIGHRFEKKYGIELKEYSHLWACNMTDHVVMQLFSILRKRNNKLKCSEFAEGFGTYSRPLRRKAFPNKIIEIEHKILGLDYLTEGKISELYLYFPELYSYKDKIAKKQLELMRYKDNSIQEMIQRVFGCDGKSYIKKKYIILEESFKADGVVNNSEDLFTYIIDIVGEENVMLKTHPRNGKNSYHKRKIQIFDAPVAWEALIAMEDMDDRVLITCSSSSSINTKLLYHSKCKIIFLNRMLEGGQNNTFKERAALEYLEKFHAMFPKEVFSPTNKKELEELLRNVEMEAI